MLGGRLYTTKCARTCDRRVRVALEVNMDPRMSSSIMRMENDLRDLILEMSSGWMPTLSDAHTPESRTFGKRVRTQ